MQGKIREIIREIESLKNAYLFNPPSSANHRREYEKRNSFYECFVIGGKLFEVKRNVSCSCKHVYVTTTIMVDGKKSTIRSLKNLLI